jgi:hypothetical protein
MQQEEIEIKIIDDERPVVHIAERQPATVGTTVAETGRGVVSGARTAWDQLPRRELRTAAKVGARVSRRGTARGLRWLSARLGALADRLRDA